jgi:hypothetical protein
MRLHWTPPPDNPSSHKFRWLEYLAYSVISRSINTNIDQKEENVYLDRVSDGSLKLEYDMLLVLEVNFITTIITIMLCIWTQSFQRFWEFKRRHAS